MTKHKKEKKGYVWKDNFQIFEPNIGSKRKPGLELSLDYIEGHIVGMNNFK